jgi:carboxyl-terminal processing protease
MSVPMPMPMPTHMPATTTIPRAARRVSFGKHWPALALTGLLAACGGGGDGGGGGVPPAASCSIADQKAWLGDYMNEWYFWYRISPRPDSAPYPDVQGYFDALLYTGSSSTFPDRDRWSGNESTESFNRFFGDGNSLGYGVSVAGLEARDDPTLPLFVRYVEARSPAGTAGVQRGDRVISMNGRTAESLIAANDFSALSATNAGETLTLVLRRVGSADRTVTLTSAVYALNPVPEYRVATSPFGRRLGYIVVKDMISQALAPMETAFAQFKAAGVQDVVLDLRYNGGGLVSTGGTLASYVAGSRGAGQAYASLLYNDKRAGANNTRSNFAALTSSLGTPRVFVLMGRRTCSASEQVINGLRGVGVDVVAVGETSCGKPVGFLPASSCGRTYSVVNFESVNARNEGRYFDGFDATCPVVEDFRVAAGSNGDPLMGAALTWADSGRCSAVANGRAVPLSARERAMPSSSRTGRAEGADGSEEQRGMMAR